MRLLSKSFALAVAASLVGGTHGAAAGSVHVFTAPSRVTVHHTYAGGAHAPHHGFFSHFFYVLFGVGDGYDGPRPVETRVAQTDAQLLGYSQFTAIPTEAQRYRLATGRILPASHGLIVLPPTTPKGDETYIWPTEEE
jgi:hypothetical protein